MMSTCSCRTRTASEPAARVKSFARAGARYSVRTFITAEPADRPVPLVRHATAACVSARQTLLRVVRNASTPVPGATRVATATSAAGRASSATAARVRRHARPTYLIVERTASTRTTTCGTAAAAEMRAASASRAWRAPAPVRTPMRPPAVTNASTPAAPSSTAGPVPIPAPPGRSAAGVCAPALPVRHAARAGQEALSAPVGAETPEELW